MSLTGAIGGAAAGPVLALVGYSGLGWIAGVLVLTVVVWAVLAGRRVAARTAAA